MILFACADGSAAAAAFGEEETKSKTDDKQRAENIRDLEDGKDKKAKVVSPFP
jgi:hypothetical protein